MKVRLPAEAHDVRSDSFSQDGDRYAWDGSTDPATLRFSIPANQSASGPRAPAGSADQQYSFTDTGEWALVTVPGLQTGWGWRGPDSLTVTIDEDVAVDGPGSTGGEIAYMGTSRSTPARRTARRSRWSSRSAPRWPSRRGRPRGPRGRLESAPSRFEGRERLVRRRAGERELGRQGRRVRR